MFVWQDGEKVICHSTGTSTNTLINGKQYSLNGFLRFYVDRNYCSKIETITTEEEERKEKEREDKGDDD